MKRRRLNGAKMRVQSFRLRLVLIPIQGGCGLELTLPQALTGPARASLPSSERRSAQLIVNRSGG